MNQITVIFTSIDRFDLLDLTFKSFVETNTYPIKEYIIINNSILDGSFEKIKNIVKDYSNVKIIINDENIGQVSSIDKAYSMVETDYIFHCEDDWLFVGSNYIEKSLDVLLFDKSIVNINTRFRFTGDRGSMHPIIETPKFTTNGTIYFEYQQNYLGEWHGFSWNPGLRRKSDYDLIKPYKQYINEQGVGLKYKELGYKSACLDTFHTKHIGGDIGTLKSNM